MPKPKPLPDELKYLGISERKIRLCARRGMSDREIADLFDLSMGDLATFAAVIRRERAHLGLQIRKAQYEVGVKEKDPSMLKWLGINHLGQSNKVHHDFDFGKMTDEEVRIRAEAVIKKVFDDRRPKPVDVEVVEPKQLPKPPEA